MSIPGQPLDWHSNGGFYTPMSKRLFEAIRTTKLAQVKILVFKNRMDINTKNDRRENCLIEALQIEDERRRRIVFSFLLKCGIDSHNRDVSGRDALEWAVKLNCTREALLLLNGPMIEYDFQRKDCEGRTVLHQATINNMALVVKAVVHRLKRYRICVDIPDSLGYTPYLYAKVLGQVEIAAILADAGASTHVETMNEWTVPSKAGKPRKKIPQFLQLKINGKLPQLKRFYSMNRRRENLLVPTSLSLPPNAQSQSAISRNISSLLQMKLDGKTCDNFVHSSSVADRESSNTATGPVQSSQGPSNSCTSALADLQDILVIVSEQMSQSFCRPAQKPVMKTIIFQESKPNVKRSTLAAIMKKPVPERFHNPSERKKSQLKRKQSRNEMQAKHQFVPSIPSIKTSTDS